MNRTHSIVVPDYGIAWPDSDEGGVEGGGQTGPRAIGASLVLIYRDPTAPYRGIVIDDGGITKPAFATMNHTITGFYQASTNPAAKMTHIVGDGRPYLSERVRLGERQLIATNPFASTAGPKWDNPTFLNLPLPPGAASAAVQVTPNGLLSDCVSYSAMVFSTAGPGYGWRRPARRLGVVGRHRSSIRTASRCRISTPWARTRSTRISSSRSAT